MTDKPSSRQLQLCLQVAASARQIGKKRLCADLKITSNKEKSFLTRMPFFFQDISRLQPSLSQNLGVTFWSVLEESMSNTIAGAYSLRRMRWKTLLGGRPFIHRSLCVPFTFTANRNKPLEGRFLRYF